MIDVEDNDELSPSRHVLLRHFKLSEFATFSLHISIKLCC